MASQFSTCSKRQYAAVVLEKTGRVIGFGYNGSPPGVGHCDQGYCPRLHMNSPSGSVYDNCIAQHAEANALLWTDPAQRSDATLIVNGPPCFGCAKQIASSGVRRLVCVADANYKDWDSVKEFLSLAKVDIMVVEPDALKGEWRE
jgi:dCMP deaminase